MNRDISNNAEASPGWLHKAPEFAGLENQPSICIFKELRGDFEHLYLFSRMVISIASVRKNGKIFIVIRARIYTEISIRFLFEG